MKSIFTLIAMAGLTACTTTKYVPVETIRTEYKDRYTERIDTFVQTDSIVIRAISDTVFKDRWRTRYITKHRTDTLRYVRTDTITKVVEVECSPTLRKKFQYRLGEFALIAGILAACIAVYRWIKKS